MPKFKNADGTLTLYALGCGYVDSFTADGLEYYLSDKDGVMLSFNGTSFDVFVRNADTFDKGGFPKWINNSRADWNQFDTLTEARKFWRKIRADIRKANSNA